MPLGFQSDYDSAILNDVARRHEYSLDYSGRRGLDNVFHFHGLENDERLAKRNSVACKTCEHVVVGCG